MTTWRSSELGFKASVQFVVQGWQVAFAKAWEGSGKRLGGFHVGRPERILGFWGSESEDRGGQCGHQWPEQRVAAAGGSGGRSLQLRGASPAVPLLLLPGGDEAEPAAAGHEAGGDPC